MRTLRIVVGLILLLTASTLRADRLVLTDGRMLEGEILSETETTLTLEIRRQGSRLLQDIPKSQVRTWYRQSTEGVPYVTLPIKGVIGEDITPAALRAGLGEARASGAKIVILAIDSPGGRVSAMAEMVDDILTESRQTEVIAYVKQAYSAAAVIAMSCRMVYMTPDSAIGAVVPFRMTDNGPMEVDAKFRSAFQAKIRATAALADHADLIIRGMSELELEIVLSHENGQPVLRTFGEGRPIKRSGQILSLTGKEALECGLSKIATSMNDLGTQIAGGTWHEVSRRPWNAVLDKVTADRQAEQAEMIRVQRLAERRSAIARIKPEFDGLARRLAEVKSRLMAHEIELRGIQRQYEADVKWVEQEFEQTSAEAQSRSNSAAMNQASNVRKARLAAIQKRYYESIATPRSEANAAMIEAKTIEMRLDELIASVPTAE